MKSILDQDFKYRPSFNTDIRVTFEKAREKMKQRSQRPLLEHKKLLMLPAPKI